MMMMSMMIIMVVRRRLKLEHIWTPHQRLRFKDNESNDDDEVDDNDDDDAEGDDVDDSCPMVVRGRLKLAQPPTTSLPFLSLPRLSQYFFCWFLCISNVDF